MSDYDIYVGDTITINSSCNTSSNAMVNFSLQTDTISLKVQNNMLQQLIAIALVKQSLIFLVSIIIY